MFLFPPALNEPLSIIYKKLISINNNNSHTPTNQLINDLSLYFYFYRLFPKRLLGSGAVDWKALPIHVLDFEGQRSYGVVEYGVVTLYGGVIAATHTRLCRAWGAIPAADSRLHGLYAEALSEHSRFEQEHTFFAQLRAQGLLAAHHAPMEQGLLASVWPYPPASPSFFQARLRPGWGPWVDSCTLYRKIFPGLERYKLGFLIATFRLQERLDALAQHYCPPKRCRYHCALYDALACALLLLYLGEQPGFEGLSVPWLLQYSGMGALQLQLGLKL